MKAVRLSSTIVPRASKMANGEKTPATKSDDVSLIVQGGNCLLKVVF